MIKYPGETTAKTAGLMTSKVLWNSVLSTALAKYMCIDIKKIYLCTPMERYKYMHMPLEISPQHLIDQYDLNRKAKNGKVYLEIWCLVYGLSQSGKLADEYLKAKIMKYLTLQAHGSTSHVQSNLPWWWTIFE